jgi:PAS domain S-box-containing protein
MTPALPPDVRDYLSTRLLNARDPAFARVDASGLLVEAQGAWASYGCEPLQLRRPAAEQIPALQGVWPLREQALLLPMVATGGGRYADVHVFAGADGTWVVFVDASEAAADRTRLQQAMNEAALLHEKEQSLLRQVREDQDALEAILDAMRVMTAALDREGRVRYLSRWGLELLARRRRDVIGRPWDRVFSLSEADAARLTARLAGGEGAEAERLTVCLSAVGGRSYWMEADVQPDPRDPQGRLLCFYDVTDACALREQLREKAEFQGMVGRSEPMQAVFHLIRDVAGIDVTVLIEGETGTGKENVARAIHAASRRSEAPFIPVNCAGLSDSLITSELFGHRKGAFTGATQDQEGLFEAAHGGTMLLDEIGDIPMNTQTRILRVLEEREVVRIGETRARRIDVRILAATNKDLAEEVRAGRFREDLLYRIRVARVKLPPLRHRREDIPLLAEHFLARACAASGKHVGGFSTDGMRVLMNHAWPGNVRELRNAVEFAVIACRGPAIQPTDLPPELAEVPARPEPARPYDEKIEKARILDALERAGGNRGQAAKLLGISRATFYRHLKACL